ncbi:hypothetical protein PQ478_08870 [Alkalihalophilus pseudofirmus]|uniref:hypothetical protein n=1 Tax=Alkalihalophilus pseudofirmus TaxID=79885 RepID=UPI00259B18C1|nr:hypothetical protein [Alkalihalophilus pseudofirmus]WEG18582.1 hypothetical protein PQ478_08870 [Alkalihalophilus pseudofirmus]
MRAVEAVKEKRNQLRSELEMFIEAKDIKYPTPTKFTDLNEYEGNEFSYIMGCINSLRNQINALEFVLNEDSEIVDYTVPYPRQSEAGVTKEKVVEITVKDSIKNWFE